MALDWASQAIHSSTCL